MSLATCVYEPEEIHVVEVNPTPASIEWVSLMSLPDTIQLTHPTNFYFDLSFTKAVRVEVEIWMAGNLMLESASLRDSFQITPYPYENGFYSLNAKVIATSGTNSLADQLGAETYLYEFSKVVWIEKSDPVPVQILSSVNENGHLVLTWERYPKINFHSYALYKSVLTERNGSLSEVYSIFDINDTVFVDPTYLGGKATYHIRSHVTSSSLVAEGPPFIVNHPRVRIAECETIDKSLVVRWPQPLHYNAFQKYWLMTTGNYVSPYFSSTIINDTAAVIPDIGFGREIELELATIPVGAFSQSPGNGYYSSFADVYMGERIRPFSVLMRSALADKVYYFNNGYLYVMNETDVKPYDSLSIELNVSYFREPAFGMSPNGQYLYVGTNKSILQLDPYTLDILNTIHLPDLIPLSNVYPFCINVSNQNLLAIDVKRKDINDYRSYVTDFIAVINGSNFQLADTLDAALDITELRASDDLRYLYENNNYKNRLIELDASGMDINRKPLAVGGKGEFSGNSLYIFSNQKRYTIELASLSVVATNTFATAFSYTYIDPVTGFLGGLVDDTSFRYINPITLEVEGDIKMFKYAHSDLQYNYKAFVTQNGTLYSHRGYRIKF